MSDNPDLSLFLQNLWVRENAEGLKGIEGRGGYKNGRYYPYKTKNGNTDVGPGFDMDHQDSEFKKKAVNGFTKEELDSMVLSRAQKEIPVFKNRIIKEGGDPDKVSKAVYNGLLDMYWQLDNSLYGYGNFWKGVASGDYDKMRKESGTYYKPKGDVIPKNAVVRDGKILDEGRWEFRKKNYFADPEEVNTSTQTPVISTKPAVIHVEYPDAIRNYRQPITPSNKKRDAYKAMKDTVNFHRFMDDISIQKNLPSEYVPKSNFYSEGGSLDSSGWDSLPMKDRAEMIRVAVGNGITRLGDIKKAYNEFALGGDAEIESQPAENIYAKGGTKRKSGKSAAKQTFLNTLEQSIKEDNRFNSAQWRRYFTELADMESGYSPTITNSIGAKGYFQLMPSNRSAAWKSPTQQFHEMYKLTKGNVDILNRKLTKKDRERAKALGIDMYGMLAGAHLGGAGNVLRALRGKGNAKDMNGTSVMKYMTKFSQRNPVAPMLVEDVQAVQNPSIPVYQESFEFVPLNPEAFFAPLSTYERPVIQEQPVQPIVEAAQQIPYSPEEIERQERQRGLNNFNMIMNMLSSSEGDSPLNAVSMLTGLNNKSAYGGNLYSGKEGHSQ